MKVCLLNDSFPPVIDGVANVVVNYARHLTSDEGAEVLVGVPKYPDGHYEQYPWRVVPYQSFDITALTSGYRLGNPFHERSVSDMAEFSPDVIHTHCPTASMLLGRVLRQRTGAPLIFTYHTKYDIDIERMIRIKTLAGEVIRAMVANIQACDDVWVVSRGAGENLQALGYEGSFTVMHNGVDFEKGRVSDAEVARATAGYDLPEGVPLFLFVGRMMKYKGLPLILDALKLLASGGQDFRMVFIGQGADLEETQARAQSLGLGERCLFTGPIRDRDVLRAWNTRASLFLFPSTFDTNGLVVREAAACGLPSVLIQGSCAAEGIVHGRNGFTVREDPAAMALLLKELCRDLPRLRIVGECAMDEIYLSWTDAVRRADERYRAILEMAAVGALPVRQPGLGDRLISVTALDMEGRKKLRTVLHGIFDDFRGTALGMAENFQEKRADLENLFGPRRRE